MFGRKQQVEEPTGRYISRAFPVLATGKGFLQDELDRGTASGWDLVSVVSVEKNGFVLVVWENPRWTPPISEMDAT